MDLKVFGDNVAYLAQWAMALGLLVGGTYLLIMKFVKKESPAEVIVWVIWGLLAAFIILGGYNLLSPGSASTPDGSSWLEKLFTEPLAK